MSLRWRRREVIAVTAVIFLGVCSFFVRPRPSRIASETDSPKPTGYPQLVSVLELPDSGDYCLRDDPAPKPTPIPDAQPRSLFSAFEEIPAHAAEGEAITDVTRPPLRTVSDTDPIYSSVAVDPERNEVVLIDTNTFGIKTFSRTENTPAEKRASVPNHTVQGPKTHLEFDNGLYIDPKTGDVTTVAADNDWLVTFPHGAEGNTEPSRTLKVTHRAYALAVNEEKQEMYISIQYPPQIAVYHKNASGDDKPVRLLKGEHTLLSDVHGMTIDTKTKLILADNWGHISNELVAGTGRFELPSISIYPLDADGDTPPLRVIQGPKTQLNWPAMVAADPATGDLFVANDLGASVLVFHETDQGDVAPYRVIKGSKTGLRNPTGVSVDLKNQELWVSNLGNSSAEAFALNAKGNEAPLRTIRTAPVTKLSLKFGKPSGTAYDTKREQLLVAN
jgi:hypothetical protein